MRKILFAVMVLAGIAGCSKNESEIDLQTEGESTLTVNITPSAGTPAGVISGGVMNGTKAVGSGHGNQDSDNTVQTLEIFVFKNLSGAADDGILEAYKKFSGSELASLSGLQLRAKTGQKTIYAVANSHKSDWSGVDTYAKFLAAAASLKSENTTSFTMTGSANATLEATTSVSVPVSRLVGRVILASVRTNFAGTPYAGGTISNVAAYLTNVVPEVYYGSGMSSGSGVLNSLGYVAADCSGCTMSNMLYDSMPSAIGDSGYSGPNYFYCYENTIASEGSSKFTRLVIQADLSGKTYYYPININREGYGYSSGTAGISRNTSYALNVVISGPGSTNPEQPITMGSLSVSVSVANWATVPDSSVNF
mgnify:CR=1 FL=1